MKDSQLYLFKMSFVLLCLIAILYFSIQALEKRENYTNIHNTADLFYKTKNESELLKTQQSQQKAAPIPTKRVKPENSVSIQLDKSILNEIFGIDLEALIKKQMSSGEVPPSSLNSYKAPNTDYCDFKHWIPRDAVRSLCPGCDPDKL